MNMEKCRWEESCGHEYCNMTECPEYEAKPMTNGGRIKAMTDAELSQFLGAMSACGVDCPAQEYCMKSTETSCVVNMLEWLQRPVKEDAG